MAFEAGKTRQTGLIALIVLALFIQLSPKTQAQTDRSSGGSAKSPSTLFEVELQARSDSPQVVSAVGRTGKLVDSGDGTVRGPKIRGKIRWSNFENIHKDACDMNIAGIIETEDGAQIRFESQGFAIQEKDPSWKTAGAMRFITQDKRYAWLNGLLANFEGMYDASSQHATMHVSSPQASAVGAGR